MHNTITDTEPDTLALSNGTAGGVSDHLRVEASRKPFSARVALGFLRLYQITLSPWIGGQCRFYPSCSNYAMQAIERFGVLKGSWLAAKRILRCQPFSDGGPDPVPGDPQSAVACSHSGTTATLAKFSGHDAGHDPAHRSS